MMQQRHFYLIMRATATKSVKQIKIRRRKDEKEINAKVQGKEWKVKRKGQTLKKDQRVLLIKNTRVSGIIHLNLRM